MLHAKDASACEEEMSHFQKGKCYIRLSHADQTKGPSMLKFGLGVVVGLFLGIYLAASFPRELGELFAWLALGTML